MCSEKRAIAVFQLQSNKAGASVEAAPDFYADLRLVHQSTFLILRIRYHREQPISENLDNFTLQRGFRVCKVIGFFGDRGLKQLQQSASFEVLPNYF